LPAQFPGGFFVGNFTFVIPPGATDVAAEGETPVVSSPSAGYPFQTGPALLWQVALHQHLRGKSVRMDLVRADGSTQCLLDIPRWDFHWQGTYDLARPVRMNAGDRVRIRCTWDNAQANQPWVNGMQSAPQTVIYGEGTNDEMCLGWGITTQY
jgi:hypothetical protein